MRRFATLAALTVAAAVMVSAQTADKKPAAPQAQGQDTEAALIKMERQATAALLKRDVAAFGAIFAEDAVFTGPDGMVQTKSQLLADVKSGDLIIEASEISDPKVRVFGESAIVTYSTTDKGKYKGRDISGRYRWTDVFVRRGGKWQIVAGQGTPIQ